MRVPSPLLGSFLALVLTTGCVSHNGYNTYGATRKLEDSDAPNITRAVCGALCYIPETALSPITAYQDAIINGRTSPNGDLYLSYMGARTVWSSGMDKKYRYPAAFLAGILDTVCFPIAGLIDTINIVQEE